MAEVQVRTFIMLCHGSCEHEGRLPVTLDTVRRALETECGAGGDIAENSLIMVVYCSYIVHGHGVN